MSNKALIGALEKDIAVQAVGRPACDLRHVKGCTAHMHSHALRSCRLVMAEVGIEGVLFDSFSESNSKEGSLRAGNNIKQSSVLGPRLQACLEDVAAARRSLSAEAGRLHVSQMSCISVLPDHSRLNRLLKELIISRVVHLMTLASSLS